MGLPRYPAEPDEQHGAERQHEAPVVPVVVVVEDANSLLVSSTSGMADVASVRTETRSVPAAPFAGNVIAVGARRKPAGGIDGGTPEESEVGNLADTGGDGHRA